MNNLLSVFTPAQTVICIIVAIVGLALIATNVVLFVVFHKRGERKLYDKLLQQERELLMQQLKNMNTGEAVDKENVDGVVDSVRNSDRYAADEEKTISDLRNVISSAAEKFEVVTKISVSEAVAVAAEPAPVPVFEPAPEPIPEPTEEEEEQADLDLVLLPEEEEEVDVFVTASGQIMRYNRSFTARIIQGGDLLQARYTELKNYLLSYKKIKSRISWKRDSFRFGRATVATFVVRGKTLCLCLALDPKRFDETKYKVKDLSIRSPKSPTPLLYRIVNDRRVNYAKELIDLMMAELGTAIAEAYESADFRMPYETTEALIERDLIRIVGEGGTKFAGLPEKEEQPAEEPVAEPEPIVEEPIAEEDESEEEDESLLADFSDEEDAEEVEVVLSATGQVMRYNRSFTARIIQGGDLLQARYTELKNYLLFYKKIKSRISWKRDSFRFGRATVATFVVRGKTLCLCLALDPKRFDETKYKVKDLSIRSPKSKTPLLYQIRNGRRVNYAKELIDLMMAELGTAIAEAYESADFRMPYETTEALIEKELIKVVGEGGAPFAGLPEKEEQPAEEAVVAENAAPAEPAEETVVAESAAPAESVEEAVAEEPEEVQEEAPAEEPAAEPEPEQIAEEAEEADEEEEESVLEEISLADFSDDEESEDDGDAEVVITETGSVIRYNRSFAARIIQSDEQLKSRYSELKNYIFSYRGVKNKISWKRETFRKGRVCLATIVVRGKTMCLCLNADPARYADTKYKVEDLALHSKKTKTPLLYRIKNDRRLHYAKELIDAAFTALGLTQVEKEPVNYAEPFAETEELIARGLIRVSEGAPISFASKK